MAVLWQFHKSMEKKVFLFLKCVYICLTDSVFCSCSIVNYQSNTVIATLQFYTLRCMCYLAESVIKSGGREVANVKPI